MPLDPCEGTVDKCPHQAAYPDNATTQQCETITKKSTSVKVYCTTVCVSSATVADDAQYVEQCECDSGCNSSMSSASERAL